MLIIKRNKITGLFTIIELLIVISIIAILACILLPAINKVRESAKGISCAGMMRQMSISITLYASDYNDWLPPVGDGNQVWIKKIWPYYLGKPESNYSLYQSANNKYVECPSLDKKLLPQGTFRIKLSYGPTQQYGDVTSYQASGAPRVYGAYVYHITTGAYKKLGDVTIGSVLLIEKNLTDDTSYYSSGNYVRPYDYNLAYYTNSNHIKLGTAWRHNFSANFTFADGRVKSYKYGHGFNTNWTPKGN